MGHVLQNGGWHPPTVPILPARAAPMGGPFEGFVFANSGFFQKAPWQALEKVVAGGGGVALGFGQPRRHDGGAVGKRKRGEKDVVSAPTHVVITDNVDAATREKLEREYPGARVVTREWVASKRRGDATPVKTQKAPSPPRTRAIVPARVPDDALPRHHPNWALIHPPPPHTAKDHVRYGRRVGARASKLERILRCVFDAKTSLNENLVASMREMARLELQGGGMRRQHEFGPGRQTLNEKELQYAVAASVLRALPARLKTESHEWIADPGGVVPYLGAGTCAQLRQMVATGTCDQLDALRAGAEGGGVLTHVRSGKVRSAPADFDGGFGSISAGPPPTKTKHGHEDGQSEDGQSEDGLSGGMVTVNVASGAVVGKIDEAGAMRDLRRLPSIGEITAKALIEAGVKSVYELKLDHSSPRGVSRSILTEKQSRCVAISDDLLSEVTASEVEEMRARLLAAARSIRVFGDDDDKNSAWEVVNVGGGRRSDASHDADFIVSHPLLVRNSDMDGVLTRVIGAMGDSILREDTDFHMLSIGRLKEYWRGVKDTGKNKKGDPKHGFQGNNDCYDKLYGIYRTANGAHRRIDVVLVPRCMLPFALIGWTGSKQYNRFLRRFAIDERGLILTSHGLHRTRDRRTVGQTPDDGSLELGLAPEPPAPSLDANGVDWWPPGWDSGRTIECERDVFELLGVPYKEPWERDCPS